MRSRYLTFIPLFMFTVFLGIMVFRDQSARDVAEIYFTPDTLSSTFSRLWFSVTNFLEIVFDRALPVWYVLTGRSEVFLYGSLGFVGILMTVLVIRSNKGSPKEERRIQSLLKDLTSEKEKAQNLARLKSEFLNQVSHELRTPLAVIMGYVDCMLDGLYGQIDAKHQEILKAVSKQSVDLKEMIDRILTFSRLEADKARLRIEQFPISKILLELRETYVFIGQQKGIGMEWDVLQEDFVMKSDPERIKEILNNLIQNAVKFTSEGRVLARIQYLSALDAVVMEVSDTGTGIPRDQLNVIFEPFHQVNKTSTVNAKGGIGLGLSIVKKHVEQLRGNVDVQSEFGKGTTFRVVLPRVHEERTPVKESSSLLKLLTSRRALKQEQLLKEEILRSVSPDADGRSLVSSSSTH